MNTLLENYLHEVDHKLRHTTSSYRTENVTELRQHLEAMIEHSEFDGHSTQVSTLEAVRQFGRPRTIAFRLHASWQRARLLRWSGSLTASVVLAFILTNYDIAVMCYLTQVFHICSGLFGLCALIAIDLAWMVGTGALVGYLSGKKAFLAILLANLFDAIVRNAIFALWLIAAREPVSDVVRPATIANDAYCRMELWIVPAFVGVLFGLFWRTRFSRHRVSW
jgi:hypothetical protein